MSIPLISLSEARAAVNLRDTQTDFDTALTMISKTATLNLEAALHRQFELSDRTETFNTRHTKRIGYDLNGTSDGGYVVHVSQQTFILSGLFFDEVQGLDVRYDPYGKFGDDTVVKPENYRVDYEAGILTLLTGTISATRALRVTYRAGIEPLDGSLSANAPDDLKLACQFQTAYLFKRQRGDNVGHMADTGMDTKKNSVATARWNAQQGLCQEAQGLVRHYRVPLTGRG